MGGKSSSSSSNTNQTKYQTTTSTRTHTENSAISGDVEEGAVAVSGKGHNITVTDGGAFELAEKVMLGAAGLITELSENQAEVMGSANQLAQTAVANVASANGVEPVTVEGQKERTKIYMALSAAGAVAAVSAAYLMRKK